MTNQQEASLSTKDSPFNNTWVIDHIDPNFRFEKQGSPIECNDPILIRHLSTNIYLSADLNRVKNDFGVEFEVTVTNHSSKNKSQNLALEKDGRITGDIPTKFQEDQNIFYFVTAPGPQYALSIDQLNSFSVEDLIKEIKNKLAERSAAGGVRGLTKIFRAMDQNGNGLLDVDDFRWGLMDFGVSLNKDEAAQVLKHFDRDGNGQVDFNEFVRSIRGEPNAPRKAIILQAYNKLDVNKDGKVTLEDVSKIYNAEGHPEVLSGRKTQEQVFVEFMSLWDT